MGVTSVEKWEKAIIMMKDTGYRHIRQQQVGKLTQITGQMQLKVM
jgi:hypothetical protein